MLLMSEPAARAITNPMATGAGFSRAYAAQFERTVDPIHVQYATERVIGDVDSFCDELAAKCMAAGQCDGEKVLRVPGRLLEADEPTVLAAALLAAHRGDARRRAGCHARAAAKAPGAQHRPH